MENSSLPPAAKNSHATSVGSSSLSSLQSQFDYNNTQPLASFQPPTPYQFFSQLNDLHKQHIGSIGSNASDELSLSSSVQTPQKKKYHRYRPPKLPETADNIVMSDCDKRQVVLGLSNYVRIFCGQYKHRFLLSDIESLLSNPVFIKPQGLDPFYEQRIELLTCLFDYFDSAKVHPLKWFDIITKWKGGHKRVMNEEEFIVGFNRLCDEFEFGSWNDNDLKQVFQFLLRSKDTDHEVRRQDIRFAMKRLKLTKRKSKWINYQSRLMKQIQRFLRRIKSSFFDFCPSVVIRKKGKTVTLHEVESMLMLILTDLIIFSRCKHIKELLSVHFRRLGYPDPIMTRKGSQSSLDGESSMDEMNSLSLSDDHGSVGSLLSVDAPPPPSPEDKLPRSQILVLNLEKESRGGKRGSVEAGGGTAGGDKEEGKKNSIILAPIRTSWGANSRSPAVGMKGVSAALIPFLKAGVGVKGVRVSSMKISRGSDSGYFSHSDSDSEGDPTSARRRRKSVEAEAKGSEPDAERTHLQRHYHKHLQPDELKYLESLAGQMGRHDHSGGGQVKNSPKKMPLRGSSFMGRPAGETPLERRHSILKRHSIIQRYTVIRTSKLTTQSPDSIEGKLGSPKNDVGDDWEQGYGYVGLLTRQASNINPLGALQGTNFMKSTNSVSDQYTNLLDNSLIDNDELVAFEASLEEKKVKHMKTFNNITSHFDRRVNIARARLNQLHGL